MTINPRDHSLSLCDLRRPDTPLIYVNEGFEYLTGYRKDEVVGLNCRMLQGPDTDPATVRMIKDAIADGRDLIVDLLNYRKDGSSFWNRLSLRAVFSSSGELTHYVGIQSDLTPIKAAEDRLYSYALELASAH